MDVLQWGYEERDFRNEAVCACDSCICGFWILENIGNGHKKLAGFTTPKSAWKAWFPKYLSDTLRFHLCVCIYSCVHVCLYLFVCAYIMCVCECLYMCICVWCIMCMCPCVCCMCVSVSVCMCMCPCVCCMCTLYVCVFNVCSCPQRPEQGIYANAL